LTFCSLTFWTSVHTLILAQFLATPNINAERDTLV
jgi:hypothetical protein